MSTGFGYNSWIGFAPESTYGTAVASAKYLELLDESIKLDNPIIERPTLRQLMRFNQVPGKRGASGSFKVQVPLTGAERLFDAALMLLNTAAGAGPYTHTWFAAPSSWGTGLSLHINRDSAAIGSTSSFVYSGCMVAKTTFVQEAEDYLTAEFEIVGKDEALEAVETPTFPTFAGFHWAAGGTGFSCSINSTATPIKRWELTIENGLADDRFNLGSRTRVGIGRNGMRKISGSIDMEFSSLVEYNLFVAQTGVVIEFDYNVSATQRLTIRMGNCFLRGGTPNVSDAGPIPLKVDFDAYTANGTTSEISIVLTNSTATY
jgi:hypothetical protein